MGAMAVCEATLGREASKGKAYLEELEVIFRGDFRAVVPLHELEDVVVDGDVLELKWPGGRLCLTLGAAAPKWAAKIRSPPSRTDKLGAKVGRRVTLVGNFDFAPDFVRELVARRVTFVRPTSTAEVDILFYAVEGPGDLSRIKRLVKRLDPEGALWVIRPKGKDTPVTEAATRRAGLAARLVDVKVAAFSRTHTAEKFMIPVSDRPR